MVETFGLEHAGADHQQAEADEERGVRGDGQRDVAEHDDDAADEDGLALAEEAVGDPAAGQAHQVDRGAVEGVEDAGGRLALAEAALGRRGRDEDHQERAHAVVAEALPHLGEEEGLQPFRVAEERLFAVPVGGLGRSYIGHAPRKLPRGGGCLTSGR